MYLFFYFSFALFSWFHILLVGTWNFCFDRFVIKKTNHIAQELNDNIRVLDALFDIELFDSFFLLLNIKQIRKKNKQEAHSFHFVLYDQQTMHSIDRSIVQKGRQFSKKHHSCAMSLNLRKSKKTTNGSDDENEHQDNYDEEGVVVQAPSSHFSSNKLNSYNEEAENSVLRLPFCRILLYILTTICLMTSALLLINYSQHHGVSTGGTGVDQHFHYHGLNKDEYESLFNQAKSIIEKHRKDLQTLQEKSVSNADLEEGSNEVDLSVSEEQDSQQTNIKHHRRSSFGNTEGGSFPSTPRDMVLAMAEDIDPKNFVSIRSSLVRSLTFLSFIGGLRQISPSCFSSSCFCLYKFPNSKLNSTNCNWY